MNLRRRLAIALSRHARMMMPEGRSFWAAGMENEIPNIEDHSAALRWAAGALYTACLECASAFCGATAFRAILVLPLLFQAFQTIFAASLTLAWRVQSAGYLAQLGSFAAGGDYRRFVPLMQLVPDWYLVLCFAACTLILMSTVQLLRRRPSAFLLFGGAVGLEALAETMWHRVPGYAVTAQQVFSFPVPNSFRDVVVPAVNILLPTFMCLTIWLATRGQHPKQPRSSIG